MSGHTANNTGLTPHVVKPTDDQPWFSMTRFSPTTDDFYFYSDDHLVILSPFDVVWEAPVLVRSLKSLEEHIQFIRENQIEKAYIVAADISFLRRCPSLKSLKIIPAYSAVDFDYSPLYDMPNLQELCCETIYGPPKNWRKTSIDYSFFPHLRSIVADDKTGHRNLESAKELQKLYLGRGQPSSKTLANFDFRTLEELTLCQSPLKSLSGIESAARLQKLRLLYCRSLEDISSLVNIGESLTSLEIQSCGKIKNFEWLQSLPNLEALTLYGSNELPNLHFLEKMPNLKSFCFTMNVLDGDLRLCMQLPHAYCQNRRHYNFKDDDLPKNV